MSVILPGVFSTNNRAPSERLNRPVFDPAVNKTYLTLMYLTAVFASKIKGFVAEKNRFPEAVKNPAFLLIWPNVDEVSRKRN